MQIKVYQRGDVILDTYLVEDIRSGGMGYVYIADHKKWKINAKFHEGATAIGKV